MPLYPQFTRHYSEDAIPHSSVRLLPFLGGKLVCNHIKENDTVKLIEQSELDTYLGPVSNSIVLGEYDGVIYRTCDVQSLEDLPNSQTEDIRNLYGKLVLEEWLIVGYAAQILHWRSSSNYCPTCGSDMTAMSKEWSRACTKCGIERYPQVSPALLMLVHDGNERIMLAHKPGWGDRYSIFAGFVLPGESLEECVHREVEEEAGVKITDLVYAGSQPWPFPNQLMIGFRARYVSGEIKIDDDELDDARWFSATSMPVLPGALSLSRQMIESWLFEQRG